MHTDWTLLLWGQFPDPERPDVQFFAEIELASSLLKNILDAPALLFMLLPVFVLTFLVAIPNALAGPALHEGITLLAARRTQLLSWGPVFRVGFGFIVLSFRR